MIGHLPSWLSEATEQSRLALREMLKGRDVALIDVPTHMNVGDSLIWRGELRALRAIGTEILYETDRFDYEQSAVDALPKDVVLLLHGGGNFGDTWPDFQQFRERLIAANHDRSIIQLPQSIFFGSDAGYARANSILGAHPDLTVLIRDDDSWARSAASLPDVRKVRMIDMALHNDDLYLDARVTEPAYELMVIARGDGESAQRLEVEDAYITDWGLTGIDRLRWRASRVPAWAMRRVPSRIRPAFRGAVSRGYRTMLHLNTAAGVKTVDSTQVLITDRLHAQVLAGLRRVPCVALDNSYGKIGALFRDYTGQFDGAHRASVPSEAETMARGLLDAVGNV